MALIGNRELRERYAVKYRRLYDDLTALLFRHDTMGINFDRNTDEYGLEALSIMKGLPLCCSVEDVGRVTEDVFRRAFAGASSGSCECFAKIAREIWLLWEACLRDDATAWSLLEAEEKSGAKSHCIAPTWSCPKCKAVTDLFIWDCINGDDDPSLRDDLLAGKLNVKKCETCGEESLHFGDLLYLDTKRGYAVKYCSFLNIEEVARGATTDNGAGEWGDAIFTSLFTRDGKVAKQETTSLADTSSTSLVDPHIVLDMGELRRYVRFRDRLSDLYEKLGDELFPEGGSGRSHPGRL